MRRKEELLKKLRILKERKLYKTNTVIRRMELLKYLTYILEKMEFIFYVNFYHIINYILKLIFPLNHSFNDFKKIIF